jgi:hypothetical protein
MFFEIQSTFTFFVLFLLHPLVGCCKQWLVASAAFAASAQASN